MKPNKQTTKHKHDWNVNIYLLPNPHSFVLRQFIIFHLELPKVLYLNIVAHLAVQSHAVYSLKSNLWYCIVTISYSL